MTNTIDPHDLEYFARTIDHQWRNADDYFAYWSANCEGLVDDHTDENQVDEWVTNLFFSQAANLGYHTDDEVAELVEMVDELRRGLFF